MNLSIITVNYNNAIGLKRTIESVVNQSYAVVEYLVIDGGSTDNSVNVIQEYSSRISYWVSEKDNGIYDAMNKGIKNAAGKYLMFLNSGDLLADDMVLAICNSEISCSEKVDIFYGDILVANHKDPTYDKHIYTNKINISFFKNDTINHQASLINRHLFEEFGYYPINYRLASDYWLFLKSCLHQKNFYHINYSIVIYDFSGISSQNNYANYRQEKELIWKALVPNVIDYLVNENEVLASEIQKLKQMLSYKIVAAAYKINSFYQKLKK